MAERLPSLVLSGSAGAKVSYEVTVEIASPMDDAVFETLQWLIGAFAEAAAHGAFPVSSVIPGESRLTVVSSTVSPPDVFSCQLEAEFVDPRAFQLLRNMAGRLKLQEIDVTRITVTELGQDERPPVELPEPDDDNEYDIYPELSSRLGFAVEGEDSDFSKSRRCLVEMRDPVEASHVLGIRDWIQPWYLLLEAGAFALPVGLPDETDSIRGSVTIFDELTVEISVDRFLASETAFFVLINMLDAYGRTSIPMARIIVD